MQTVCYLCGMEEIRIDCAHQSDEELERAARSDLRSWLTTRPL